MPDVAEVRRLGEVKRRIATAKRTSNTALLKRLLDERDADIVRRFGSDTYNEEGELIYVNSTNSKQQE